MRNQMKKMDFLSDLPYFAKQTQNQIRKLVHSFALKSYCLNQVVFQQGVLPDQVYIVATGDFEITRR